jgi:NAD(P)-dependent dehydrogenase (short-subunit alcohol dehydrogenase family)
MTVSAQLHDVARASLGGRRVRLAAEGAAVALTYREAKGPANNVVREIIGSGGQALAVQADNEDPEALRAAISETVERFGGLELLVNNAGTSHVARNVGQAVRAAQ